MPWHFCHFAAAAVSLRLSFFARGMPRSLLFRTETSVRLAIARAANELATLYDPNTINVSARLSLLARAMCVLNAVSVVS